MTVSAVLEGFPPGRLHGTHHGIYVGQGQVVHYRGFSGGLRRGPLEEVSLSEFSEGHPIWIRPADANGAVSTSANGAFGGTRAAIKWTC